MHKLLLEKIRDTMRDDKGTILTYHTHHVCRTRVLNWIEVQIKRSNLLEERIVFSKLIEELNLEDHEDIQAMELRTGTQGHCTKP